MIVLDTHAWIWWIDDPSRLSAPAREEIDRAARDKTVRVSSISAWEAAMLVDRGRLELTMQVADWIACSEALPFLTFVPVDNAIALRSVLLAPPFPADPADRIIIATAMILGASLVTKDRKIQGYSAVRTIW